MRTFSENVASSKVPRFTVWLISPGAPKQSPSQKSQLFHGAVNQKKSPDIAIKISVHNYEELHLICEKFSRQFEDQLSFRDEKASGAVIFQFQLCENSIREFYAFSCAENEKQLIDGFAKVMETLGLSLTSYQERISNDDPFTDESNEEDGLSSSELSFADALSGHSSRCP